MTPESFATHSMPVPDQFKAWRGWLHSVFDVMPRQPLDAGIPGGVQALEGWHACDQSGLRRRDTALPDEDPNTAQSSGSLDHYPEPSCHYGRQDWRRVTGTPAGLPFVLSLGDKWASERSQDDRLLFYLPRDSFREIAPALDATRGAVLNTPRGKLLGDYITWLERILPDLMPDDLPQLTGAVRAMVTACIMPSSDHVAIAASQIDLGRLERVRRAVRSHLHSPSLGSNMLCRQLATSRSQLYRLLEDEGSVMRYIQRQRLLEGHAALCDASNIKPIAVIAEELCFADGSRFSHAFRHEFGTSPTTCGPLPWREWLRRRCRRLASAWSSVSWAIAFALFRLVPAAARRCRVTCGKRLRQLISNGLLASTPSTNPTWRRFKPLRHGRGNRTRPPSPTWF